MISAAALRGLGAIIAWCGGGALLVALAATLGLLPIGRTVTRPSTSTTAGGAIETTIVIVTDRRWSRGVAGVGVLMLIGGVLINRAAAGPDDARWSTWTEALRTRR